MIGLFIYAATLILLGFALGKIARTYLQIFALTFVISALLCSIFQIVNCILYEPDKFIAIAIAVQFTGGLILSFLFGALSLIFKKKRLYT